MPSNSSAMQIGYFAGRYPGRIGWLLPVGDWRTPFPWLPYALDNGAFGAYSSGKPWEATPFVELCLRASECRDTPPRWVVVPDVVADRDATLRAWDEWAPRLQREFGWPLAFAVQDGMNSADVPSEAAVIFVGGSTAWKWRTLLRWCALGRRVHVGRVNGYRRLWDCHDAGAESCDGTGWMRGDQEQLAGLGRFLEESTAGGRRQGHLLETPEPAQRFRRLRTIA